MKYPVLTVLLLLISIHSRSQTVIQGTVKDPQQKQGLSGINIMLQESGNSAISGFALTDKDGKYRMEYKGEKDTLIISVSGFNIKKQTKTVARKSQTVDFELIFESISLKEVKITPLKIRQTGDTINYLVDGFLDKNDRTIGDVLKKMPGIDVKESGQIFYQNRPINKMYIEDLDLLQGRYGIATNNIEAKDVQTVQVMENHQPIKTLKDKVLSEDAALNLKLKDSAKGTLIANALVGAGASPLLGTGEVTAMYFAKTKQNITTYKGNNTGNDVSRELTSFYSRDADRMQGGGLLSVQSPSSPPIYQKRYLFNQANAVTFSNLLKLKNEYQLNANVHYLNDQQNKSSFSRTEYYLPGNDLLLLAEKLDTRLYSNNANAELQLTANKDKFYLNNLFKLSGNWDSERGNAISADSVHQQLDKPNFSVNNTFELVKNYKKTDLNISSFNGYSTLPHTLSVQPVLYDNLFDSGATEMRQSADINRFASYNKVSAGWNHGKWKQNYEVGFRADLQQLNSALSPSLAGRGLGGEVDSLRNDLQWNKLEWIFAPRYTFIHNDLRVNLGLPVNYSLLHINDRILQDKDNTRRLYFNPSLLLQYKLSVFWNASASANYSHALGGINNEYTGYIMRSYRNLVRNTGNLYETTTQNYRLNLSYRHPIQSLFGNAEIQYFNNRANLLYGYDFDGILQVQTSLAKPNTTEGISTNVYLSQTIDVLASTVGLSGNYAVSSSSQLTQSEIIRYSGKNYSVSPSITTKIRSWSSVYYGVTIAENRSQIKNRASDFQPIRTVKQAVQFNIFPVKGLTINLNYEYFYNNALVSGSRSLAFGDIGAKYKWKKMEFLVDYSNIFNSKQYISTSYNEMSSYYYAYDLRPAEIVFRVRFKIN
jgi:hypothetical protein